MITRIQALCLLCFALFASTLQAQSVHPWHMDGEIYVKYKNTYTMPAHGANGFYEKIWLPGVDVEIEQKYGVAQVQSSFYAAKSTTLTHILRVSLDKNKTTEFIKLLQTFPFIEYAEPVPYNVTGHTPNDLGGNGSAGGQWYLWTIKAQQAWDYSKGDSNVVVAVIDDEVYAYHTDLFGNMWRNPGEISGNKIDDDGNGYVDDIYGYDVGDNDNDVVHPFTNFTHGTHVGGIIGATSNNGTGIASIGYNVSIMGVKCTFNNQSNPNSIPRGYEGITYAANAGADIINCSWSSGFFSQAGQDIIDYAVSRGCMVFAAASNDGKEEIRYPAAYDGVIAVASTEQNDSKSDFSNYGTWVDVSAPGRAIRSTLVSPAYGNLDGTSMATPLVAGLAALMKSHNRYATNAQIEYCLLSTTDNINAQNSSYIGKIGSGRINAEKALQCMDSTLKQAPQAKIESSIQLACPSAQVSFRGISTKGTATGYKWYFPNGTPATSTLQNPIVTYTGIGKHDVTLVLTNSNGKDSLTLQDYIDISAYGREEIFSRDFETGTLASMGFTVENPDNGITWNVGNIGGNGTSKKALFMNFYSYSLRGQKDALITPVINLSSHANARLTMQHAYRRQNTTRRDSLVIYVSTDGGATYPNVLAAFGEDGTFKFATAANLATAFTPNASNNWCFEAVTGAACIDLDLSDFDGETNVRLKFETYNDFGNNLFIDNMRITGNCASFNTKKPQANFTNDDTTFCIPSDKVKFTNKSVDFPTSYQWIFEGGTPAVSDKKNPLVEYTTPGTYDVTLITENAFGTDTMELKDYIVAATNPVVFVNADKTLLCKGESASLFALGADITTWAWTPVFAISSTSNDSVIVNPPSSATYNVKGTSSAGCSETKSITITVLSGPGVTTITRNGDSLFATNGNPLVTMQWLHNGNPINGANSRSYKPLVFGNYGVRVTDTFNCSNNSPNYLYSGLGVEGIEASLVKVFPNPASGSLFITNDNSETTLEVSIFDYQGRRVADYSLTGKQAELDIKNYAEGLYFIVLQGNNINKTEKVIIFNE